MGLIESRVRNTGDYFSRLDTAKPQSYRLLRRNDRELVNLVIKLQKSAYCVGESALYAFLHHLGGCGWRPKSVFSVPKGGLAEALKLQPFSVYQIVVNVIKLDKEKFIMRFTMPAFVKRQVLRRGCVTVFAATSLRCSGLTSSAVVGNLLRQLHVIRERGFHNHDLDCAHLALRMYDGTTNAPAIPEETSGTLLDCLEYLHVDPRNANFAVVVDGSRQVLMAVTIFVTAHKGPNYYQSMPRSLEMDSLLVRMVVSMSHATSLPEKPRKLILEYLPTLDDVLHEGLYL
jgi:hypothetical protein